MRFLLLIVSSFLVSCVADAPFNMEDPVESHGKLDPEAQKRLADPKKTYKELEEEIEQNRLRIEELESQINLDQLGIDNKKDLPVGEAKTEDKDSKNKGVKGEKKVPESQEKDEDKENKKSKSPNKNTKPENKVSRFNAFDLRMPASSEEPSLFSQLKTRLKALGLTAQTLISSKSRLMLAAEDGDVDLVRYLLLEREADPNETNRYGLTPLMYSMKGNPNLEVVRFLLEAGAYPDKKDNEGKMALDYLGQQHPQERKIKSMLETVKTECRRVFNLISGDQNIYGIRNMFSMVHPDNCSVKLLNRSRGLKYKVTFLLYLLKINPYPKRVEFLLNAGADVDVLANEGRPGLLYFLEENSDPDLEVVRLLLNAGADVNARDKEGKTALLHILSENSGLNPEIVKLLLDAGANPNPRRGWPLMDSLRRDHPDPEVVRLLLDAGANVNARSSYSKMTALSYILSGNRRPDLEVVRLLLDAGAHVSVRDKEEKTALEYHVSGKFLNLEIMRLLLEKEAGSMTESRYILISNYLEQNQFHPDIEEIMGLLNRVRGVSVDDSEGKKTAPRFYSYNGKPVDERCEKLFRLTEGSVDDIRSVLETGIDPNVCQLRDIDGSPGHTLLMYLAIYNPDLEIMRILLNARAHPNTQTGVDKYTALMFLASYNPNIELMKLLLDSGADVNATNRYGKTALWFHVKSNTDPQIVQLLLDAGADPNAQGEQGYTVLMSYLSSPYHNINAEIVRLLLAAGADPSIQEKKDNATALSYFRGRNAYGSGNYYFDRDHPQEKEIKELLNVERRKEQVERWLALSFSEREKQRLEGQRITEEFAGLQLMFPEKDIQAEIQAIETEDSRTRKNIAERELLQIHQLTSKERIEQDTVRKKIESVIAVSQLSEQLQGQIELINKQDEEFLNQWARSELTKRLAMNYEERSSEEKNLSDLFELSRLSEGLRNEIRTLEEGDAEIAENRRRASLWAAQKAREQRLRSALETISDPTVVSYRQSRVKLWPIRCRNSNNPVYPYTRDDRPMSIELKGRGLRLEIRSQQSDEFTLLAEGVRRLDLQIEAPRDLYDSENYLSYKTLGERQEETFRLNNLIDIAETKSVSYLRISSSDSEDAVQVSWRGVKNRFFKGGFRIEITDRRSSDRSEWSVINELPVEWYIQSVTSSEMPSSYTLDALKAQAVAARSYFLNKALADRNVQARGWDIDPTQCNQVYKGSGDRSFSSRRGEQINIAVAETTGLVLTHNGKLAQTQYYACGTGQTKKGSNFIERSRNIPRNITCSRYPKNIINHHGYGMPQFAANYLTKNGWPRSNDNSPTEGAKVPDNIREPWDWMDVLNYFYRGESSRVKVQDFRQL